MERAQIVHVEDVRVIAFQVKLLLESYGHEIIDQPRDVKEALQAVSQIAGGLLVPDLVILDGNFGGGLVDCSDAKQVIRALHEINFAGKIVGFSSADFQEHAVTGIDGYVQKPKLDELVDKIDRL